MKQYKIQRIYQEENIVIQQSDIYCEIYSVSFTHSENNTAEKIFRLHQIWTLTNFVDQDSVNGVPFCPHQGF